MKLFVGLTYLLGVSLIRTGESYTYDANGNMITRIEGGLTYTQHFDKLNATPSTPKTA